MTIAEVSFESLSSVRVTWSIPDFFRLAEGSDYSIQSPDFTFFDGSHCLRLFHLGIDLIGIELVKSIDPDAGRVLLYEIVLMARDEILYFDRDVDNNDVFCFPRVCLEYFRDMYVPDGTLTLLCSVRSREPGSPECGGAQIRFFPPCRMTGNLSFVSFPLLYVTWRIPAFFSLPQKYRWALKSPDFPFSDRRYRLRLLSTAHYVHTQLVNLSDPVPGRYVSYEFGLKSTTGEEIGINGNGPSSAREFSILRSHLDYLQRVHFPDGDLTVFFWMRSRESSSGVSPKQRI